MHMSKNLEICLTFKKYQHNILCIIQHTIILALLQINLAYEEYFDSKER